MPWLFTRLNRVAALRTDRRTQPCEAARPRLRTWLVPWMAWPWVVKNIAKGMGASSHSFEKCVRSIRNGR